MKDNRTFTCPNCGEDVSLTAKACPFCGSDEQTGWAESTYVDSVSEAFDEEEYAAAREREFPNYGGKPPLRISWLAIVGAIVLFLFVVGALMGSGMVR